MRIVVVEFMTLDGVMEAPGFEEHRSGRNGWAMRVDDPELQAYNGEQVATTEAYLFGRRTWHIWEAFWPQAPEVARDLGERITATPKYVYSKSLRSTNWANTTILRGGLREEMQRLRDLPGGELKVYGSADLVAGLLELDLVDELRIILFPVLLGSGKRLFPEEALRHDLRLLSSRTFTSGAVALVYDRHGTAPVGAEELGYRWTDEHTQSFRAAEENERRLATVLFTDIVDSTGRAAALGDREWRRLLDRHDEIARTAVRRWQGEVVKGTGDGILATFESPTRALRCALALRAALDRIGVPVRTAIHTAEVEVRGADIGGVAVHIASRVLDAAEAGQIIVTRTVRDLAVGVDVELRPMGSRPLRGLAGDWELFAAPDP